MMIPEGIEVLSRNLVAVLNQALLHNAAIVPDIDPEGVSYSIEWMADGAVGYRTIEWNPATQLWGVVAE